MRKKIGELLVETGATTPDQVSVALGNQRSWGAGQRLGQVLVHMGGVTHQQVGKALALQFDLPFIELPQIPSSVSQLVPVDFQSQHEIVPFRVEVDGRVERVHLAVSDPSNLDLVDELRFQLGKPLKVFVAARDDIQDVLAALRGDAMIEVDPLEVDEEEGEMVIERQNAAASAPGGWFATAPGPEHASPPPPGPPPPAPASPAPPVAGPPLPAEWDVLAAAPGQAAAPASGDLDQLLGAAVPVQPPQPAPPPPAQVVSFQKAPAPAPAPPPPADPKEAISFSEEDLAILEDLGRMAQGEAPALESAKVKPAQMVASLIRLLMKKGVIGETEFLEELGRK